MAHCRATLLCGCSGSMKARFASAENAHFFFQPVQLHFELPDLLVEWGLQGLVIVLPLDSARGENLGDLLVEWMFPVRDLGGMHPLGTGELIDRFVSFDGVQRDPRFELRTIPFPLCRHLLSPPLLFLLTQHSILSTCPVFGEHYNP